MKYNKYLFVLALYLPYPLLFGKIEVEEKFVFKIDYEDSIDVLDFSEFLSALSSEYYEFVAKNELNDIVVKNNRLSITQITNNCISMEFIVNSIVPVLFEALGKVNNLAQFGVYIHNIFLSLKSKKIPKNTSIETLRSIKKIITPAVKDTKGQLSFQYKSQYEEINFAIDNREAKEINHLVTRALLPKREKSKNVFNNVLFYWYNVKNDHRTNIQEKGIIESQYDQPIRVSFDNEEIKNQMIFDTDSNFFNLIYRIDVRVETINDIPTSYNILQLHEILDKNTNDPINQMHLLT